MAVDEQKLMCVPDVSVQPSSEKDQLLKFARCIDNIEIFPAEFADGKDRYTYKDPKGKETQLLLVHVEKMRVAARKKFSSGFADALSQVSTAMNIYKSQKTTYGDRAIGWVIEKVGRIEDPGEKMNAYLKATISATSAGKGKLSGTDKFEEAADLLIDAASAAASADRLIMAYKEKIISSGELVVKGLLVVQKTCEITLEVGAIVLSGGAATAAIAGSAAIGVTEAAGAPLLYGDSDKIDWGKLAAVGVDVAFKKFGAAEKAEKFIFQQTMKTALGKELKERLGEAVVRKYVTKFIAEKGLDFFKKAIEGLGKKPKEMNWKTFFEKVFITKLTEIFLKSALPNSIPTKVKEEIAKSTGKKVGQLVDE